MFDDQLLAALPDGIRAGVAAWNPSGRFDLRTSLTVENIGPMGPMLVPRSMVTLRGASVRPESFPVELTDIEGRVRIEPSLIAIDEVVGRYRDATISASGAVQNIGPIGPILLELAIRCRDLRIDEELRTAAPPKLHGVLTDWSVDGPIAADILVRRDSPGDDLTYHAKVDLEGVNVRHSRFPIPFENVHGALTIETSGVHGIGLHGRYGGADVQVDFDTHETSGGEKGTIVLKATGLPLDGNLRDVLPEQFRGGWDRAGLRGSVDAHLRIAIGPIDPIDPITRVEGRIDLHQVDAPGIAEMGSISGTLTGSGTLVDQLGGTTLAGDLQLLTANVYARNLTDIKSDWSLVHSADGRGRLALDGTHAAIYGGALTGHAELLLGADRTKYNLTATVHGMQIAPWLLAGQSGPSASPAAESDDAATHIRGMADAYVYLSGEVGDPLSRRGGGQLEVRDGYIYRLPILLAILNVLDMSVPNDDALHALEAEFFVLGNRLNLEEIALRGGSLNLVGSGSMSLPDQAVDLRLVNVGNRFLTRVPVLSDLIEGAAREIVELRVTGPVSRPTVRAQPLRALTDELNRLFQKKPPKKIVRGGS